MTQCLYCGMHEATTEINNPNGLEEPYQWPVCADCKDIIYHQQGLSFATMIGDDKKVAEHNLAIETISRRSGIPVITATITNEDGHLTASTDTTDFSKDKEDKSHEPKHGSRR